MPASVILPTRIRVDPDVLTMRRDILANALAAAAERALISSRDVVLAPRGGYASVRLAAPRITWSGGGLHRVPVGPRRRRGDGRRNVLSRGSLGAPLRCRPSGGDGSTSTMPEEVRAPAQDHRFALDGAGYLIPSYQPDKGAKDTVVRVKPGKPGRWSDDELKRIQTTAAQLGKDDGTLLLKILSGTRTRPGRSPADPVNVEILRLFAGRDPATLRKLLLDHLATIATGLGRFYAFSAGEFKSVARGSKAYDEVKRYVDMGADAIHLATLFPEAAWLIGDLERRIQVSGRSSRWSIRWRLRGRACRST